LKIDFEGIAEMTAARLQAELAECGDVKKAKDLSSILKDLLAMRKEHAAFENQAVIVEFLGRAGEDSV